MSASPPPLPVGEASPVATAESNDASLDLTVKTASATNEKKDDGGFLTGKTFVQKIHTLLAMPEYSSIISWNDAGTAVTVHDVDAFISTIIPKHFRKSKFGSFIRKMRRWGFSVITLKRSTSNTSTSSERGRISVIEFSNEHFLRDKPDQCSLMKDERHVKKQFSFMDSVRTIHRQNSVEGSSIEPGIHNFRPSLFATNMHPMNHQAGPNQYSRGDNLMPPVAPMTNFNMMQSPNMMQPPTLPPPYPQYQPYGYGTPLSPFPHPQGQQFGSNHCPHQHLSPGGYPPYYYSQQYHQHQMMQQNHPQQQLNPMMMKPDQMQGHHQMMQQNQYYSSPPRVHYTNHYSSPPRVHYTNQNDAFGTRRGVDIGASDVALTNNVNKAVVSSGSEESSETILANNRTGLGVRIQPQKDS